MKNKIKLVEINAFNFGSTGTIMHYIAKIAKENGINTSSFTPTARMNIAHKKEETVLFGTIFERRICEKFAIYFGLHERLNIIGTISLIHKLNKLSPDIIHLHNIHGDYINIPILFEYIKRHNIPVVWTFHDCWPYTGHCPYYTYVNCQKWKTGCYECEQLSEYPVSKIDDSTAGYLYKKKWIMSIPNLTIVVPSRWLMMEIKNSFLKDKNTIVINNGIDLTVFKPVVNNIKNEKKIDKKKIVLSVAFFWDRRKGYDRILRAVTKIPEGYIFVVIGKINNPIVNNRIIHINQTSNQNELVEWYSAADVFLNPTYEDNFPTVNIEALACGTPVLSFGAGGSAEVLDGKNGRVVTEKTLISSIIEFANSDLKEYCVKTAKKYCAKEKFMEYVSLFKKIKEE